MKKSLKTIIATVAAIAIICILFSSVSYAKEKEFERLQLESSFSVCTAQKKTAIKSAPFALGLPKGFVPEGSQIKVLAVKNNWCKIVAFTDKEVKAGYVKSERLGNLANGIIPAVSIDFDGSEITLNSGDKYELKPAFKPYYSNEAIEYTSSDNAIAEVKDGIITANSEGSAVITAKAASCTRQIKINVALTPKDIKFSAKTIYMDKGSHENLLKQLECESADKYNIKFYSSDSDVVKLNGSKAAAINEGEATLTAKAGTKHASCRVIVRNYSENASSELKMKNAYGNYIGYHPSVQFFENKWNGYTYWCAYTPYQNCNDFWENPHIAVSNDLVNWETPQGFSNPLEPVPDDYERGISYNSDTELVYNTDKNQLECWWRYYDYRNMTVSLYRKVTKDGVHWSEKEKTMSSTPLNKHDFLSPALVYENHTYKMWAIDLKQGYVIHYYESADGINWTKPVIINVEYENPNIRHWHMDVIHTPKGYEMLLSAFPKDSNDHLHMSLYYAFSKDNKEYTKARIILKPSSSKSGWDNQGLYRSSLLYANNKYYCFYSGVNTKTGPTGIGVISGDNPFHMN